MSGQGERPTPASCSFSSHLPLCPPLVSLPLFLCSTRKTRGARFTRTPAFAGRRLFEHRPSSCCVDRSPTTARHPTRSLVSACRRSSQHYHMFPGRARAWQSPARPCASTPATACKRRPRWSSPGACRRAHRRRLWREPHTSSRPSNQRESSAQGEGEARNGIRTSDSTTTQSYMCHAPMFTFASLEVSRPPGKFKAASELEAEPRPLFRMCTMLLTPCQLLCGSETLSLMVRFTKTQRESRYRWANRTSAGTAVGAICCAFALSASRACGACIYVFGI